MNPSLNKQRNLRKKTSLTVDMMAKVIYHIDENGICRNNEKSYEFMKFKKFSIERKRKVISFVENAKKNGTPINGCIENVKILTHALTREENNCLLQAILPFLLKKPAASITSSTDSSNIRYCVIYHFDNFHCQNNQLYNLDVIQQFIKSMHICARTFIEETMKSSLRTFDALYPNPDPRYCFVNSYSEGTKEYISMHRDQVSFLSIVVALQGDFDEPANNCLRISNMWNPDEENSKYIRLGNGDAVIFERLYHSIIPISNRMTQRVTINIFY